MFVLLQSGRNDSQWLIRILHLGYKNHTVVYTAQLGNHSLTHWQVGRIVFKTKLFILKMFHKELHIVCLEPSLQVTNKSKFPAYIFKNKLRKGQVGHLFMNIL